MIVFVLRHADRELTDALSEDGIKRAKLLARMLAESGVRTAFRSDTVRARDTLQPLNDMLGANLAVEPFTWWKPPWAPRTTRSVSSTPCTQLPPDATAVVIGHTTTVGRTIKGLTGQTIGTIEDARSSTNCSCCRFRRPAPATVTLLRYGAAPT